jgi:phage baseplate assembly protein W
MYTTYPYQLDGHGRTALTSNFDDHISQMLEQLLFTRPGERVNRPDFGCGLANLVFEPNSDRLAAALEVTVVTSIGQWLGDLIQLQNVDVESQDEKLLVNIAYLVKATGEAGTASVTVAPPP